jgi:hypothetical protein
VHSLANAIAVLLPIKQYIEVDGGPPSYFHNKGLSVVGMKLWHKISLVYKNTGKESTRISENSKSR